MKCVICGKWINPKKGVYKEKNPRMCMIYYHPQCFPPRVIALGRITKPALYLEDERG